MWTCRQPACSIPVLLVMWVLAANLAAAEIAVVTRENGQQIEGHTTQTTWNHSVNLDGGSNSFTFAVRDRAGNLSEPAVVDIIFDDSR